MAILPKKPFQASLRRWERLQSTHSRKKERRFLVEGHKTVRDLLQSDRQVEALLLLEGKGEFWEPLLTALPEGTDAYRLTEREWSALTQDRTPEGVMAVVPVSPVTEPSELLSRRGDVLLVYRINNPSNLGAVIRSADWFGFRTILLSEESVDCTHPKVVRASMGSLFRVAVAEDVDFSAILPEVGRGRFLVASHARRGIPPHSCAEEEDMALLIGSESHGLPEAFLTASREIWSIPGPGNSDSLSLPQAAAILMYASRC